MRLPVDARVDTAAQAAAIVRAKRRMGLRGGVLVTVPAPPDEALPRRAAEEATEEALREAERRGVRGKEMTPFLLAQIAERTGGESIRANVALLRNNAAVAAQIAVALAER